MRRSRCASSASSACRRFSASKAVPSRAASRAACSSERSLLASASAAAVRDAWRSSRSRRPMLAVSAVSATQSRRQWP